MGRPSLGGGEPLSPGKLSLTDRRKHEDCSNMTRSRQDIIDDLNIIAESWNKSEVEFFTEGVLATIISYLVQGDRIELRGFGVLETEVTGGKRLVNRGIPGKVGLQSGTQYIEEEKIRVKFKPSSRLTKRVQREVGITD